MLSEISIFLSSRYLDDVSLHHLINALCSLSLEAMEMAYGNNKVNGFSSWLMFRKRFEFDSNLIRNLCFCETYPVFYFGFFTPSVLYYVFFSGAVSVCSRQAAWNWFGQHGSHRDPVETTDRPLIGGNDYLEQKPTRTCHVKWGTVYFSCTSLIKYCIILA